MAKKRQEKVYLTSQAARSVRKTQKQKVTSGAAPPGKKAKGESRRPKAAVVRARLAEPIPDEVAIQKLLTKLDPVEQSTVKSILQGLEEHFGSIEAARIWLVTKSPEFGTTPLEAIRNGKGKIVQAVLEARWGPNPIYA